MPFCSNCGKELKTGAKFCNKCGAQMSVADPGACPVCLKPVTGNEKFCVHCGASIANPVSNQLSAHHLSTAPPARSAITPDPPSPPAYANPHVLPPVKQRKKGGCIWKSLLVLMLLVAAGLTVLYFIGDEPGDNSNSSDLAEEGLTGTDIPGIVSIYDSVPEETITETNVDTGDPQQAAITVEDAFARADTNLLKQMLTPDSREIYKEAFREIKPFMNEYSKAFSNRKLKISTPIYSLYEFTDADGKKYTAEFALSDDGQWKLVRF
jgi:hypothetical protein